MTAPLKPRPAHRRRFFNAFKQVSVDEGSNYPCSKEDITTVHTGYPSLFQDLHDFHMPGGALSAEEATAQLERFLLPSSVMSNDLLVKTCLDWDRVFFAGNMKGRLSVRWSDGDTMRKDFSKNPAGERALAACYSYDYSSRWGHATVYMNADRLLLNLDEDKTVLAGEPPVSQFRFMWAILLHELCHAYLAILTSDKGYDKDDFRDGYDELLGKYFQRCVHAVDRSARQLLGLGANRNYASHNELPIRVYDVENHIVQPKQIWQDRVIQKCRDSVHSIALHKKGMPKLLILHSNLLIHVMYRFPANVYNELRILRFNVKDSA
ncbi:MAG: hypothetical protein Q9191_007509, partial [Dirinaria sp. TL-2023a]